MLEPFRDVWFTAAGVRLHAVEAGPLDGPVVLLLHGFPEFWYGWRKQLEALGDAGYRAVALDQRGYNTSDHPPHATDYNLDLLAGDVEAVARLLSAGPVALVGHDWGGGVAWWTALRAPELYRRLVILNAPHPSAMRRLLARSPRQMARSWYMAFFQLPALPEWYFSRRDYALGKWVLTNMARPGTFSPDDLARYVEAWSRPGAVKGMIDWYRALVRAKPRRPAGGYRVKVPTKILWGRKDTALGPELAAGSAAMCDSADVVYLDAASHWVQHEEPAEVNRQILEFLR